MRGHAGRVIDVAFSRVEIGRADVVIVLDVLRATSTIVSALDAGYQRVLCVASLDRARRLARPGRTLAGERDWVRPEGFSLGNSPSETQASGGSELVLATTNGSATVTEAARRAETVLIGSLLNLDGVVAAAAGSPDVQVVCSGTRLRPALEDVYVAGRIAARLGGEQTDAARVARAVADRYPRARDALDDGTGAAELRARGLGADVAWCAQESVVALAPRVWDAGAGVAVVVPDPTLCLDTMDTSKYLAGSL